MQVQVHSLTYNPFAENTYILSAPGGQCIIIDPGCYDQAERDDLVAYITSNGLQPVRLINTHCHVDHILGNAFVAKKYNLGLEIHEGELPVLQAGPMVAGMYAIAYDKSPDPISYLKEGDVISFGGVDLQVLFTPGHSPASICLYNAIDGWVIGGDVLFHENIGRTDLPGGNFDTLIRSIKTKLFTLPNETVVYPGHGIETTVGYEKMFNPFMGK